MPAQKRYASRRLTAQLYAAFKHRTHLDVLLGVLEVVEEGFVPPGDAGLLVGGGVGVSLGLSGLAAEEAVEVGPLLVGAALLDGVALRALGLEDLGPLLFVAALLAHGCFYLSIGP